MPRRRRAAARRLTQEEWWELGFAWGGQCRGVEVHGYAIHRPPCDGIGCWSVFLSDEEREEAYWSHRDELLHSLNLGFRPPSFWAYEAPTLCRHSPRCPPPAREDQEQWLAKHDQLTPRELADLRKRGTENER